MISKEFSQIFCTTDLEEKTSSLLIRALLIPPPVRQEDKVHAFKATTKCISLGKNYVHKIVLTKEQYIRFISMLAPATVYNPPLNIKF